jgi:lactoylglutathione lyase
MSTSTTATSLTNIGVVMFNVTDQDAARDFYTEKLGFEVRADEMFGENKEMRWLEVAPAGSATRLALNLPMEDATPGGGMIGVDSGDVPGEHDRIKRLGDVDVDQELIDGPDTPQMFMLRDPDGNVVVVVEEGAEEA